MIKNWRGSILGALCVVACAGCPWAKEPALTEAWQGIVEHDQRSLAFELPGRLKRVAVTRGQPVQAGDPIAELDDGLERPTRDVRAADLRAAEAQLALVRAGARQEEVRGVAAELRAAQATETRLDRTLERQRQLAVKGVAPTAQVQDLEDELARTRAQREAIAQRANATRRGARPEEIEAATARVEGARAALAAVEARLARYVLRAPVTGVVIDVPVEEGEVVGAGGTVALLADTAHPYVDVFVPEGRMAGVRIGRDAEVKVDAHRDAMSGRIEDVGRTTEFTPRYLFSDRERPNLVVRVRVRVDDPRRELPAGVPAFVTLRQGNGSTR